MAVNGIPTSVEGLWNKYPGFTADWEYENITYGPGTRSLLFQVKLNGGFALQQSPDDIAGSIDILNNDSTNKWTIEHSIEHSNSIITLTMHHTTNHPTVNTKMRIYKAAVELERLLLVELIPFATQKFGIRVTPCSKQEFDTKVRDMQVADEHWTREWLNDDTMTRIYEWITTIVPTYDRCWMPDDTVRSLHALDVVSDETTTGDEALSSSHRNALIVTSSPRGESKTFVVSAESIGHIRDSQDAQRYPCKTQTTEFHIDRDRTLKHTLLVDLNSAGLNHQLLVRKSLLDFLDISSNKGRILRVFPSFDKFPGLLSEASTRDQTSRLHCNPDATDANGNLVGRPTIFKTYGIAQCPGETLVKSEVDKCTSNATTFRIRKERCKPPFIDSPSDPTCCEIYPEVQKIIGDEMRIYGNRTIDTSTHLLPLVEDAYKWFKDNFGIAGRITIDTDDTDDTTTPPIIWKAFTHFKPNCSTLRLVFGTENGRKRAIEFMRLATENQLVNNASFMTTMQPTVEECLGLLKLFPQNRTEIVFTRPDNTIHNIISGINQWFHTLEHRQLDIIYVTPSENDQDEAAFERVRMRMIYRGYRGFGPDGLNFALMKKDHVRLTADLSEVESNEYEDILNNGEKLISLRFVAGARFTPVAMKENRQRSGKRKLQPSGGGASSY